MSLRIGLYDFFSYTLGGVFYIFTLGFGLVIFDVINIDFNTIANMSLFTILLVAVAGYLIGMLMDQLAYKWASLFQWSNEDAKKHAFERFHARHPQLKINFEASDAPVLLNAIKYKSMDLAKDVEQSSVTSILLRNVSFGFAILSMLLLAFFLFISLNLWNLLFVGISASFSIIAIRRSRGRRYRYYSRIFEAFAAIFLLEDKDLGSIQPILKETVINEESEQ